MKSAKLEVKELRMEYDGKLALEQVSFDVKEGEFLSILGPSGCGKTTIMRILIGLQKPTSGCVLKDGIDISNASPADRGMGIVFQNYALFENMTVLKNVEYALRIRKGNKSRTAKERVRTRAMSMLRYVGLEEYADKFPAVLSGGQQQRVAIARTLVLNPDIILFDEPMSALDIATRLVLRAELKRIQREFGTTMLYITHDQEEAFALSDRIMVMREAAVVQVDTPENIIANPADEYVREFVLHNIKVKIDSLIKYARIST